MTKRLEPQVTIEKLVALGMGCSFLVVCVVAAWIRGVSPASLTTVVGVLVLVVAGSLGLIWFDDVVGNRVGLKSGLVSKTRSGFLLRLMGWLFLFGIIGTSLDRAVFGPVGAG